MTSTDTATIHLTEQARLDASIVERALAGDRDAMAELYDRHADRIHTMCAHMLGDPDEAADACAQVFLVALQRLHQLREPAKLRSWLFAIARHEVYRRSRERSRTRPAELGEMPTLAAGGPDMVVAGPEATGQQPAADPEELAELLQTAAGGLEDRDRTVLELNVVQGLEGQELADALGVKLDHAYQLTHRMKERLERSTSALLVVSAGRSVCEDLDGVAANWDGNYDVLWRKRFARHVERCERCQRMKRRLPKAVLSGAALSQAAQAAVLAAPISVRKAVLEQAPTLVASSQQRPWSRDGFPGGMRSRRGATRVLAGCLAAVLLVLGTGSLVGGSWKDTPAVSDPAPRDETVREVPAVGGQPGPASPSAPVGAGGVSGPDAPPFSDPEATGNRAGGDDGTGPQTPDTGGGQLSEQPPVAPGDSDSSPGPTPTRPTPSEPPTGGPSEPTTGATDPGVTYGPGGAGEGGSGVPVPGIDPKSPPVIWVPPTFDVPPVLLPTTTLPVFG